MPSKRDNPSFNAVSDSVDMMKKMWGLAGLPGLPNPGNLASMAVRLPRDLPSMVAPTFDLEELDKRIADLRAVEQWLEINANMLRATIQTLEVQRATIATLKGISGAMLAPMAPRDKTAAPTAASFTPPEVAFGARAMAAEPVAAPQSSATVAPAARTTRKRTGAKKGAAPAVQAPVNPVAWWNTLQDQFTRIAESAAQAAAPATKPRAQPKARKANRKKA
jgi:hypothetical protein